MELDFGKLQSVVSGGMPVVPVVVQDIESKAVLILAYVNQEALDRSLSEKRAIFWSTSRQELWEKGKTSGNELELVDVCVNCEENSLLFLVRPLGSGVCHVKDDHGRYYETCFYRGFTKERS